MELTEKRLMFSGLRWKEMLQRTDIMASIAMVSILMIMIIPLPAILLDLFLSTNITIALLILVISLYTVKATVFFHLSGNSAGRPYPFPTRP